MWRILVIALAFTASADRKKLNLGVVTGELRKRAEAKAAPEPTARASATPGKDAAKVSAGGDAPLGGTAGEPREAGGASDLLDLTRTPPELEERRKGGAEYVMTCRDGNGRIYKEGEAGFDLCAEKARRDSAARTAHGSTPGVGEGSELNMKWKSRKEPEKHGEEEE